MQKGLIQVQKRKKRKISKRQKMERIERLAENGKLLKAIKSVRPTPEKQREKQDWQSRKGKHLNKYERGKIDILYSQGYSAYQIGKILNRAPNTIRNELKRGTTTIMGLHFEEVRYLPDRGQAIYLENRKRSKRPLKARQAEYQEFINYVEEKVLKKKWSLDAARGYALHSNKFTKEQVVSIGTLYNYVERGVLNIRNIDLPMKPRLRLKKEPSPRIRKHKRLIGQSIESRPQSIDKRIECGHWEIDTVIGKKVKSPALLTLTERCTRKEIIEKMEDKSAEEVMKALRRIENRVPNFRRVCKSITTDNGLEFARLCELEKRLGISVYYAHPYSAYERGSNERNNREIRKYIPKSTDIGQYSHEQIRLIEEKINTMPRRLFDYATSEELYNREVRRLI